jgi:glycosyltransferase involved in cell wall biosynthesis
MTSNDPAGAPRVAMLAYTSYMRDSRVRQEAEALVQKGLDVHVVSLSERNREGELEPRHSVVNGIHVHRVRLSRKRGGNLRYLYEYFMMGLLGGLKLASLHFNKPIRVVHVHNMPDILVLAAAVPRLSGCKLVLDVHDPMPELFASWKPHGNGGMLLKALRWQEKISFALADNLISVNETMRENLESKGVPSRKIFIVHNFPDATLFPVVPTRPCWPRTPDCLVMLYCGTITEHYDVGLAIKVMARLKDEVPLRLRLLGEGNRLEEVLQLASALGVADRVEHAGLVPIDRVRDEMQNADIGISCHRAGIFGDLYFSTKILEYLSQGLPVLSPRTYTIEKYLSDDCLFYFEPGNEVDMAETLRRMWHNPDEVTRRLNAARQLLPKLSWQAEKGRLQTFYSELISDGKT